MDLKTAEDDDDRYDEDDSFDEDAEFTVEDYMNDEEYFDDPSYKDHREDSYRPIAKARESFSEHLLQQLYLLEIPQEHIMLGEEIIGNLDSDGYLGRNLDEILNDLETFQHVKVSPEDAETVLKTIQTFDPPGIASRNLRECLIAQLHALSYDPYYSYLAELLLNDHYDSFLKKHYNKIREAMNLSEDTFHSVIQLITKLNPKPGFGKIENYELNQITPDFILEEVDGGFRITLNDRSLPTVTLSKTYLDMFTETRLTGTHPREKKPLTSF
jgi:RNA polymerase sigma-54 factor